MKLEEGGAAPASRPARTAPRQLRRIGTVAVAGAFLTAAGVNQVPPRHVTIATTAEPASLPAPSVSPQSLLAPDRSAPVPFALARNVRTRRSAVRPAVLTASRGMGRLGNVSDVAASAGSGEIPAAALAAYQRAEAVIGKAMPSCGVSWPLVAALGRVESNHGRANGSTLNRRGVATPDIIGVALTGRGATSRVADSDAGLLDGDRTTDRAIGPMQFLPSTWSVVGVDADGDGQRNPQDIDDAALAAAVYLCGGDDDLTTPAGRHDAVFSYNHSESYVETVLALMRAYATAAPASWTTAPVATLQIGSTPSIGGDGGAVLSAPVKIRTLGHLVEPISQHLVATPGSTPLTTTGGNAGSTHTTGGTHQPHGPQDPGGSGGSGGGAPTVPAGDPEGTGSGSEETPGDGTGPTSDDPQDPSTPAEPGTGEDDSAAPAPLEGCDDVVLLEDYSAIETCLDPVSGLEVLLEDYLASLETTAPTETATTEPSAG